MISQTGLALIQSFEGLRLTPYRDPGAGYWTIGWGHKIRPGESFSSITRAQADALLVQDLAEAEDAVSRCVKVPLSQSQYDALVSLTYNWGGGNFCNSLLLQRLNAGDYLGAAARLREHPITGGGVVLEGLVRRRAAEADLFLSGTGNNGGGDFFPDDFIPDFGGNESDTLLIAGVVLGAIVLFLTLR